MGLIPYFTTLTFLILYYTSTADASRNRAVPSAPLNFAKKLINSTSVRLTWEEPLNWNGNKFGYNIFFQKMANGRMVGSPHQKALRIPEATETVLDNLLPNTEYAVWMNAFNRNGDGEFVEAAKFVTEGIPPSPPEVTGVVLLSDEKPLKARIDWKTPIVSPLAKPIDKYHLWYRTIDENATETHLTAEGTATSIEFSNLLMGREYLLSLAAESGEGIGLNSTERLQTPVGVPDGNIDTAKTLFNLTPDGKKMTIRWEPLEESKRNGNITSYKAILTPMDSTAERMELEVPGTASPSATFNVRPRTSYTFKVAAATMKGLGPYSPVLTINPDSNSLVGPPTNVRVEATSNSSAVIQWDFEAGQVDGFIVKFMHEPSRSGSSERWHQQTLMNPSARHLEVPHLTDPGPYAFCVLAIKNSRQGPCSDPPMVLERLTPTFMVQKLNAEWATSVSVKLKWDYNGPSNVVFYLNHTGKKEYFDNNLALKTMTTPGFKKEVDASSREYLWTNLRPYMQYTFHVGVRTQPPGARHFWPREVVVITAPTGPPFVETPMLEDIANVRAGQAGIRLKPASEEYGPIEAYWIIVVPGNYSMDDVVNLTPSDLERATVSHRAAISRQISASPSKLKKRSVSPYSIAEADDLEQELKELEVIQTTDPILDLNNNDQVEQSSEVPPVQEHHKKHHKKHHHHHKKKRSVPTHAYIAAKLSSDDMRSLYQADRVFLVGDEKNYNGFTNFPLEPGSRYRLMMRAFAKKPDNNDLLRAPMTEKQSKMYSDSALSETFTTKAALRAGAKSGGVWLLGPLIALLIIAILIGMLVCWWLRCNKKSAGRGHRHGSITKVALTGNIINGGPSETSKLLSNDSYARPIMNPYEPMNGNAHHMESSMDLYPLPNSHSRGAVNGTYAPVPIPMPHMNGNIVGQTMMHPVIPITELASHIDRLRVNNNAGFQQEFESIETGQHFTWEHSNMEYNKHKNRYANVVAYDHSRVILSNTEGIHGSDYINANYIDGYEKSKAYIATQGPLPETFGDFWRMVWEEGSAMIVMLTNLEERARIKCDQYWPTRGSSTYGDVQVTLMETTVLAHYTMRTMRLQVLGEPECREIRHLQYTAWPDHGVPDHPTPFLIFLKRVKTLNSPGAGPIISHCSAGIGRTGAFIVIDCMLERLRYENTVDIFGCVTALRSQRSYMVQTEDQYIFIHDAVLDAVNSGSTEIPANKLQHHVNALQQLSPIEGVSGIEMEFRHLATLKWSNTRCGVANLPANRHKNRTSSIVPFDSNRVVMHMIPGIDGSDYINASWIDGYRERGAYIATQGPTEQTLADFWRMVWEHDCAIIVMLTKTWEMGREKCVDYWPLENAAQVGTLIVEPIAEYNMPQYIMREFKLSDCQSEISRTVRHFQFTEWPEQGTPDGGELFIDFVQQVHRTKSQFGVNGPIVVHCSSGAGRTGAFIALATIIDRMKLEHVVDVFTTVKLLRTERVNMVKDSDQYHFLYHAALEYLATFDQYSS